MGGAWVALGSLRAVGRPWDEAALSKQKPCTEGRKSPYWLSVSMQKSTVGNNAPCPGPQAVLLFPITLLKASSDSYTLDSELGIVTGIVSASRNSAVIG